MSKDTRLIDLATQVEEIKKGNITEETLWELVLSGYKCFKQGSGIHPDTVKNVIKECLERE